jgi:hypothetical protein
MRLIVVNQQSLRLSLLAGLDLQPRSPCSPATHPVRGMVEVEVGCKSIA